MKNKTILHYKILEELGCGGMGIMYKAHDTELERDVAIKFLPAHIANDADERERFKIEAKAAAALNHASIATIYSIEKSDDETFIIMEYIDGHELKDKIAKGPVAINDVMNFNSNCTGTPDGPRKRGGPPRYQVFEYYDYVQRRRQKTWILAWQSFGDRASLRYRDYVRNGGLHVAGTSQ